MQEKKEKLTLKQQAFIDAITDSTSKGYNNSTESAAIAGYKGNRHMLQVIGSENMSKPVIKAAIDAIYASKQAVSEYNQAEAYRRIDNQYRKADRKGDVMAAMACIRELDSIHGLNQQTIVNVEQQRELSEEQARQAKMIASYLNRQAAGTDSPTTHQDHAGCNKAG